jgi:hypothetical protein
MRRESGRIWCQKHLTLEFPAAKRCPRGLRGAAGCLLDHRSEAGLCRIQCAVVHPTDAAKRVGPRVDKLPSTVGSGEFETAHSTVF